MPMTKNAMPEHRDGMGFNDAVKAGAVIFKGAIVVLDGNGFAMQGNTIANGAASARGIAFEGKDNSAGADGAVSIELRRGCFRLKNAAGGEAVTQTDINGTAYVVDDETVGRTNQAGTLIAAGTIRAVDAGGVWVDF